MRKLNAFIFITTLMFLGFNQAKAENYALNCYYDDNGAVFSFNLSTYALNDEYGVLEAYDNIHPINLCDNAELTGGITSSSCYSTKRANLIRIGMMDESGLLKCPLISYSTKADAYIANAIGYNASYVGTDLRVLKNTSKECNYPKNCNFLGQDVIVREPAFTCLYKSTTSNNTIKIARETDGGSLYVTNPAGEKVKSTNGLLSESCSDIYYIASTDTIKVSVKANEEVTENATLLTLCRSYNSGEIEHFCTGDCEFEERACSSTFTCGGSIKLPKALATFSSNLYNLLKVMLPILLIILGIMDMIRNVMSSDDAEIKKRNKKFIKRMIAGVMVFLVMSVVQMVFGAINLNNVLGCLTCFTNGGC